MIGVKLVVPMAGHVELAAAPTKGTVVAQPARNGPTKTIRIVRRMTARLDPVLVNALNAAASFAAICASM